MALIAYDSKAARFLGMVWKLFILNLLWLLCSIPILTLGAASIAASHVSLKLISDKELFVPREFFKIFKENLLKGFGLTLILAVALAAVWLYTIIFNYASEQSLLFSILSVLCALLIISHFLFVFPLAARYDDNIFRLISNSRYIFVHFFPKSILCILVLAFEIFLFGFNGFLLFSIGLFVVPGLSFMTISSVAYKIFKELEGDEKDEEE